MRWISSIFDRAVCVETCVISPEIGVNMGGHWGLIMFGDNRIAGGVLKGELSWWEIGSE